MPLNLSGTVPSGVLPATQEPGGGVDSQAKQLQRLKELMLDYSSFLFSVMLLHPEDLMSQLRVVNCETLELSDTPEQVGGACWRVCVCVSTSPRAAVGVQQAALGCCKRTSSARVSQHEAHSQVQ